LGFFGWVFYCQLCCQDILVNMMVAQATRQPPVKLTQRKQLSVSTPPAAASAVSGGKEAQHRLEEFQARVLGDLFVRIRIHVN
jgi:hypothetical protein